MRKEIKERILEDPRIVGAVAAGEGIVWFRVQGGKADALDACPVGGTALVVETGSGAGFVRLADYVAREGLGEEVR